MSVFQSSLKQIRNNPVKAAEALQKQAKTLKRRYRDDKYDLIAAAYGVARALQSNEKRRDEFFRKRFWKVRKKRPNKNDILLNAMVFVFGASDREKYGNAWKYAKAVRGYWTDSLPAAEVAESLARDKLSKLLTQTSENSEPKAVKPKNTSKKAPKSARHFELSRKVAQEVDRFEDGARLALRAVVKGKVVRVTRVRPRRSPRGGT